MNKATESKIGKAISELGNTSYRKIADKAGVSLGMITRYYHDKKCIQAECIQQDKPEVYTAWDGRHRPLLSMIGYLPSPTSPLGEGRPLVRVPDYSMAREG